MRSLEIEYSPFGFGECVSDYHAFDVKNKAVKIRCGDVIGGYIIDTISKDGTKLTAIKATKDDVRYVLWSDEDEWGCGDLIDLSPTTQHKYEYRVVAATNKIPLGDNNLWNYQRCKRYVLYYYQEEHAKDKYQLCENCGEKIVRKDFFCKYCGKENYQKLAEDEYSNFLKVII